MFKTLKTDYIQLWVIHKDDLRLSTAGNNCQKETLFKLNKDDNIFPIIDQKKVIRVPL